MYTMYELTMGNFVPVTRYLMEHVGEGYAVFLIFYRFLVGFACIKVITGVFMHETFRIAASDDDLMVVQKSRATQRHVGKMCRLLKRVDKSSDGKIQKQEFIDIMTDKKTKTWL